MPRVLLPLITLGVFIGVWIFLASRNSPHLLPGPNLVWSAFLVAWGQHLFQPAFATTLTEAVAGWAVGSLVALPLGYLLSRWRALEFASSPYLAASQAMPVIAIAPLLFIWLGFGMELKIVIAALIAFFPVAMTTTAGFRAVDKDMRDVARVFGANWRQTLIYLEGPQAARWILSGERIAITLSVTGAFVGELVNPDQGLGAMIVNKMQTFDTATVFVGVFALMLMGGILYGIINTLERMVLRWTE